MKKILAGMTYRLFKGFEIWALIGLFFFSFIYLTYIDVMNIDFVCAKNRPGYSHTYDREDTAIVLTHDNADQFCFKYSGISAKDAYRYRVEKLPQEEYDMLYDKMASNVLMEVDTVFHVLLRIFLIPSVLMGIFIPVFFGRMFSDGTVKNLISCGFGKGKIYLATLLMTFFIDLVLTFLSVIIFAVICIRLQWQPPIYLPVLLPTLVIAFLLLLNINSVCIAILFVSKKKVAAFIAAFLMFVVRYVPSSFLCSGVLWNAQMNSFGKIEQSTIDLIKDNGGQNGLEKKINLSQFIEEYYVNGQKITYLFAEENSFPPAVVKTLLVFIYIDPYLIDAADHYYFGFSPYMMARDGLMTINIASNIFWISFVSGLGLYIFKKREIHC